MTEAELARLSALADAATPGPWSVRETDPMVVRRDYGNTASVAHPEEIVNARIPDAAFIAASREAVPTLVAEVREQARSITRLIASIKYLRGIAEKGFGRAMQDDETVEGFVLAYVKSLEARAALEEKMDAQQHDTYAAARDEYRKVIAEQRDEITRLRAENERLREALNGVIRVADRDTAEFSEARAALKEKQP